MKTNYKLLRLGSVIALAACVGVSSSCMTTYDAQGRPVQSVDPGLAVAGVAAAGLIGYAAGNNHNGHHYRNGGYYGGGGYHRSGGYYRR
ncbi:MAG: hypothetical protein K9N23_17435 [Akkermansiaceae bacterium]|nr:hypothetical protein [Akkermansiaceae bacterium]MCF7733477.1 hypothetical protein [Akkermansiaceae bacterium]